MKKLLTYCLLFCFGGLLHAQTGQTAPPLCHDHSPSPPLLADWLASAPLLIEGKALPGKVALHTPNTYAIEIEIKQIIKGDSLLASAGVKQHDTILLVIDYARFCGYAKRTLPGWSGLLAVQPAKKTSEFNYLHVTQKSWFPPSVRVATSSTPALAWPDSNLATLADYYAELDKIAGRKVDRTFTDNSAEMLELYKQRVKERESGQKKNTQ